MPSICRGLSLPGPPKAVRHVMRREVAAPKRFPRARLLTRLATNVILRENKRASLIPAAHATRWAVTRRPQLRRELIEWVSATRITDRASA